MPDPNEIIKEYPKGEALIVLWKPKKCIHSEICVKTLPRVYRPKEKPWIRPGEASVDALKHQIDQCPSGALTYREKGEEQASEASTGGVRAQVVKGGPLLVSGVVILAGADQSEALEGTTAFCRCGASANKPYCDGSHKTVNFD